MLLSVQYYGQQLCSSHKVRHSNLLITMISLWVPELSEGWNISSIVSKGADANSLSHHSKGRKKGNTGGGVAELCVLCELESTGTE